jgi:hypothetical protein
MTLPTLHAKDSVIGWCAGGNAAEVLAKLREVGAVLSD